VDARAKPGQGVFCYNPRANASNKTRVAFPRTVSRE
jgi:hypothetical protein